VTKRGTSQTYIVSHVSRITSIVETLPVKDGSIHANLLRMRSFLVMCHFTLIESQRAEALAKSTNYSNYCFQPNFCITCRIILRLSSHWFGTLTPCLKRVHAVLASRFKFPPGVASFTNTLISTSYSRYQFYIRRINRCSATIPFDNRSYKSCEKKMKGSMPASESAISTFPPPDGQQTYSFVRLLAANAPAST
jgi:hypothetical protein